jgi:hypothetical protein
MLSPLDRPSTEAAQILTAHGDVEIGAMAEELRELLVDMQAKVEKKLDECGNTWDYASTISSRQRDDRID